MTEYQETIFLKLLAPLIILFIIAVIYFIFNKKQTLWSRIFASSHSLIAMVGALYAIIASKYTAPGAFDPHTLNFSKILAVAVIFGFIAVLYFKGNKKVHLLLLPFVFCVAYIWHVGGMAITHNWA
jgi:hypothetical protein